MLLAIMAICVALNLIVILIKYERRRYLDAFLDSVFLVLIAMIFSSSFNALVVGTFASMIVSIYLYIKPPHIPKGLL